MKELVGYFLIAQAILTGIIVYSIQQLADSIKASTAFYVTKQGSLTWGNDLGGMPTVTVFLLMVVIGMGIFLIAKKKWSKLRYTCKSC